MITSSAGLRQAALVATTLIVLGCHGKKDEADQQSEPVVSVQVRPLVRATLHEYVKGWGTVEAEPATPRSGPASAKVAAPVAGLLAQVRCAEGQQVKRGGTLFVLDTRIADLAVAKARQALRFAEAAFERQKALGPGEATSVKQYQEAEQNVAAARNELGNAEAERALLDVRAPLSGTVVKLDARPGDAVEPTTVLAEVVDLQRLVVTVPVRSGDAGRVRLRQPALLVPRGVTQQQGTQPIRAVVVFVGAAVDSKTDTVDVRVAVPPSAGFRPGQFLDASIVTAERSCLAAPLDGLVTEDDKPVLAVVQGDKAVKRPVRAGLREGDLVEVAGEGLHEGLSVVGTGAYGLPHEARIRVAGQAAAK